MPPPLSLLPAWRKPTLSLFPSLSMPSASLSAPQADMREMQNMYRAQYDELLTRAGAGVGNGIHPPA